MKLFTACAPTLAAFLFAVAPHSYAADEKGLPASQLIAAIQSATASTPGNVKEVEVDTHNGQVVIEVTIVGSDGREKEIKVNPANNQVVP
nr:PepSY domain-containing protein [uncultured Noviherbaspirillum sp.]